MSAELLGLAFKAEMGSHVAKLVLLKLVDAGEDDGTKIYPAIATIARAAQAHERTVQKLLRTFQEIGLLHLVRKGGGGPGDTTEYRLDLGMLRRIKDLGWKAATTAADGGASAPERWPEATHGMEEPKGGIESAKGGLIGHPTPPIDPSLDPLDERERRAREAEPQPSTEAVPHRALLDELIARHPQGAHDRLEDVIKPWLALSPEERRQARDRFDAWLGARGKRQAIAGLPTYLADRMVARVAAPPARGESLFVPAFSAAWWQLFHAAFAWADGLSGKPLLDRASAESSALRDRAERARKGLGWKLLSLDKRREVEAAAAGLVAIRRDGPEAEAWRDWFAARGVALPTPDKAEWIYMPARWPEAARADDRANAYAEARG